MIENKNGYLELVLEFPKVFGCGLTLLGMRIFLSPTVNIGVCYL